MTAQTDLGPVACQIYGPQVVIWDEPISYPAEMSQADAVSVCRQKGMARKNPG